VFWYRRPDDRTRRKVAILSLTWFAFEIADFMASWGRRNNLWIGYLITPVQAGLVFWILYDWQTTPVARRMIRWLMPATIGALIILNLRYEDLKQFSLLTATLTSIVLLGLSLFTLVTRSLAEHEAPLLRRDWFWICCGLALYFSLEAGVAPLMRYLLEQKNYATWEIVWRIRVTATIATMLILTRGLLCPLSDVRSMRASAGATAEVA